MSNDYEIVLIQDQIEKERQRFKELSSKMDHLSPINTLTTTDKLNEVFHVLDETLIDMKYVIHNLERLYTKLWYIYRRRENGK